MFKLYYINAEAGEERLLGYCPSLPGIFVTEFLLDNLQPIDGEYESGESLCALGPDGTEYYAEEDYTWQRME